MTSHAAEEASILRALEPRMRATAHLDAAIPIALHTFRDGAHEVHVAASGVGLSNAAMATALCANAVRPQAMLMIGTAHALAPTLGIGHLVVASHVLQYDGVY